MSVEEEKNKLISSWHQALKQGSDYDLWGQPLEAVDIYRKLATIIRQEATPNAKVFTDEQKKVLNKICACLELRAKALQLQPRSGSGITGVTFEDLKKVEETLKGLLSSSSRATFPIEVAAAALSSGPGVENSDPWLHGKPSIGTEITCGDESVDQRSRGSILPAPPPPQPGQTLVAVRIHRIGLKDAAHYIDSFITVSVRDAIGMDISVGQDTPVAAHKEDTSIIFGNDVYIQEPLELLPKGFAIFFEFKHYKPAKQAVSTRCWAFLEKDEIKDGNVVIELYKKPTDPRRKKLQLLTVKPLYLHLHLTLHNY